MVTFAEINCLITGDLEFKLSQSAMTMSDDAGYFLILKKGGGLLLILIPRDFDLVSLRWSTGKLHINQD